MATSANDIILYNNLEWNDPELGDQSAVTKHQLSDNLSETFYRLVDPAASNLNTISEIYLNYSTADVSMLSTTHFQFSNEESTMYSQFSTNEDNHLHNDNDEEGLYTTISDSNYTKQGDNSTRSTNISSHFVNHQSDMVYMENKLSNNLSTHEFTQDSLEDYTFNTVSTEHSSNLSNFQDLSTVVSSEKGDFDSENQEQSNNISTQESTSDQLEGDRYTEMDNYKNAVKEQQDNQRDDTWQHISDVSTAEFTLSNELVSISNAVQTGFDGLSNNISSEHSSHDAQLDSLNSDVSTQLSTDKQRYDDNRASHNSTSTAESVLMANIAQDVTDKDTNATAVEWALSQRNSTNFVVNSNYDLTLLETIPVPESTTSVQEDMVITNQHFLSLGPYWRIKATDNELQFQFNQNPTDPSASPGWMDIPFAKNSNIPTNTSDVVSSGDALYTQTLTFIGEQETNQNRAALLRAAYTLEYNVQADTTVISKINNYDAISSNNTENVSFYDKNDALIVTDTMANIGLKRHDSDAQLAYFDFSGLSNYDTHFKDKVDRFYFQVPNDTTKYYFNYFNRTLY